MEIADIRKMAKMDAEAKKKRLLEATEVKLPEPPMAGQILTSSGYADLPNPIIYCASCKYWERDSDKAVFAACGLSRRHGLAVGVVRTDTDRCSLAEAR